MRSPDGAAWPYASRRHEALPATMHLRPMDQKTGCGDQIQPVALCLPEKYGASQDGSALSIL